MAQIFWMRYSCKTLWIFSLHTGSASSNGSESRDHNQVSVSRDSRDSRDDREDSGSEDDSAGRIRVGKDYQVITPNWVPPERKNLIVKLSYIYWYKAKVRCSALKLICYKMNYRATTRTVSRKSFASMVTKPIYFSVKV